MARTRPDSRGFSLAEILVVLAILALAVAVSVPLVWHQIARVRVHTAELQFAADLKVARMIAVSTRKHVIVQVNVDPVNEYTVPGRRGDERHVQLPDGIEIRSAPASIEFRPDGSVRAGAEILLVADAIDGTVEQWTLKIGVLGTVRTIHERLPGSP